MITTMIYQIAVVPNTTHQVEPGFLPNESLGGEYNGEEANGRGGR